MNQKGYLTRAKAEATGKPIFTGHRWIGITDEKKRILLTRNRCQELGRPVQNGESPAAYRYSIHASSQEKYIPLYDRTHEKINKNDLYRKEVYPFYLKKHKERISLSDVVGSKRSMTIETFEKRRFKKKGLHAVDLTSNEVIPLSQIYYRIRVIRDQNGNLIAKRLSEHKELFLVS